jgi:hypothetical protein
MPEQLLHLVEINPGLHQPRSEGVPEIVEMKLLDLGLAQCEAKGPPEVTRLHRREGFSAEYEI